MPTRHLADQCNNMAIFGRVNCMRGVKVEHTTNVGV